MSAQFFFFPYFSAFKNAFSCKIQTLAEKMTNFQVYSHCFMCEKHSKIFFLISYGNVNKHYSLNTFLYFMHDLGILKTNYATTVTLNNVHFETNVQKFLFYYFKITILPSCIIYICE